MTEAKGGAFYKEHLPVLGEDLSLARHNFHVGDRVWVDLEVEAVRALQSGHGGWTEGMSEVGTK